MRSRFTAFSRNISSCFRLKFSNGIRIHPSAEPRRAIAGGVVRKPRLLVSLATRKAVALRRTVGQRRRVRDRAVWMMLLVRDRVGVLVELEHRGAEMVVVLKAHELRR